MLYVVACCMLLYVVICCCYLLDTLKGPLDNYISQHLSSYVTVIRNANREGLIRSRMIGARQASAKVGNSEANGTNSGHV